MLDYIVEAIVQAVVGLGKILKQSVFDTVVNWLFVDRRPR